MKIDDFQNRLSKTSKHLKKWAAKVPTTAYRIYDRDIPEFPFIVERYNDRAVIWEKRREEDTRELFAETDIIAAVATALQIEPLKIHLKTRSRMPGAKQYEKLSNNAKLMPITEGSHSYLVNLSDYLDTGIFLDMRPLRMKIAQEVPPAHGAKFLNLFCYTATFSVVAAQCGYHTTSIDLSTTYLEWAEQNFLHNKIAPKSHEFIRADITVYLHTCVQEKQRFDLIYLDPPSFSNSKKMSTDFDIVRDHKGLIQNCMTLLNPGGTLYFTTNKRRFKVDEELTQQFQITDITQGSIPQDFSDKKIHRCFEIKKP